MQKDVKRIKELTTLLNHHRDAYYNNSQPEISDYEYDVLYDELKSLENKTGICFNNSPTQSVGYVVKDSLEKVKHKYPMLSLDKTKKLEDLIKFLNGRDGLLMLKCDGLTTCIEYDEEGNLVQAETRGDGEVGTLCTDNVKTFDNVPLHINHKGRLIVFGESIVKRKEFEEINSKLSEDDKFKTQRNMASGSLLQLDSKVCAERHLSFIAWRLVEGSDNDSFIGRLDELQNYGFDVVPGIRFNNDIDMLNHDILTSKDAAEKVGIPIDGLVVANESVSYGESLGATSHHRRAELAFKFGEDEAETTLIGVDFTMGKTGSLTPVLHFKPVELMDTTVEYASAHNLSILKKLGIKQNSNLVIVKKNDIIPQCVRAYGGDNELVIPDTCPVCNGKTEIVKENDTEVLMCTNPDCKGKLLGKLTHAVSKNALNIDGISEATIEKLIELGWLNSIQDIYRLSDHTNQMMKLEGFGKASVNKLLEAIEQSKHTTLDRFVYALSINLIGRTASKAISNACNGDYGQFVMIISLEAENAFMGIDGFGKEMNRSLISWWSANKEMITRLKDEFVFEKKTEKIISGGALEGKNFSITGKLNLFENRDALIADIESKGGKFVSSVSKTTDYLINNDNLSQSSKNVKAAKLGVPVITEEDYMKM